MHFRVPTLTDREWKSIGGVADSTGGSRSTRFWKFYGSTRELGWSGGNSLNGPTTDGLDFKTHTAVGVIVDDTSVRFYLDGSLVGTRDNYDSVTTWNSHTIGRGWEGEWFYQNIVLYSHGYWSRPFGLEDAEAFDDQARRGFPDLLRTRSTAPLVSTSGGGGAVTISASLTEEATASSTFSARSILRSGITEGTQAADALGPTVSMADAVQEAANAGEQWASQLLATASVAEGAQGTEDFAASLASAVQGALTENSQASDDFLAALAQVASVTEAALADVSLDARQDLVAVMQEEATAGESLTASVFTLLTGAVNEGAAADEAWASNLRALANLTEEAQADEVFAATLEGILTGVLDENTEAAETFLAALDTSGTITESGQAGASFAAVRTLFASLQEEASASGDYDADLTLAAEIQEGATAAEDFTAQMRLVASVTEDVQAEDAYTAVGRVASLTATLQVTAALSASLDVSPDE